MIPGVGGASNSGLLGAESLVTECGHLKMA